MKEILYILLHHPKMKNETLKFDCKVLFKKKTSVCESDDAKIKILDIIDLKKYCQTGMLSG